MVIMKNITINVPESYIKAIKILNDLGKYASRSEAIRKALLDFLANELIFYGNLDCENFEFLVRNSGGMKP